MMDKLVSIGQFAELKGIAISTLRNRIAARGQELSCVTERGIGLYSLNQLDQWHCNFIGGRLDKVKVYNSGKKNASIGKSKSYCSEKNPILSAFWLAGWHDWHIENRTGVYE